MSIPSFDIPRREPRMFWLWILLFTLFALLIVQAVAESFAGDGDGATLRQRHHDQALRQTVMTREVLGGEGARALEALDDPISELAFDRKTDLEAAAAYVVFRYEQGKKILPADLDPLKRSASKPHRLLAEIYGDGKLSSKRAEQIRDALSVSRRYIYERAGEHALSKAGMLKEAPVDPLSPQVLILGLFMLLACFGGLAGVSLWIVYAYQRSRGRLKPLGFAAGDMSLGESDRFAGRALQVFGLFLVAGIFSGVLSVFTHGHVASTLAMILFLLSLLLLSGTTIGGRKITLKRIGLTTESLGRNILWGIGGLLANIPVLVVLLLFASQIMPYLPPPTHPISKELEGTPSILSVLSILFLGSIVAPIWEEICFRGILAPALSRLLNGVVAGIFFSSFLFAAIHPQGIAAWLMLGWVGAMGALLSYQTRSLIPAIVMHALHNGVLLVLNLIIS